MADVNYVFGRKITEQDLKAYATMNALKHLSRCIDKQVVCLICDEDGEILSLGVNTVELCDKNCDDKAHRLCVVSHAEEVAVRNLCTLNVSRARRAYVSLFPCKKCQETLEPYVDEIVTFGMAHKDWVSPKVKVFPHLSYKLMERNGRDRQISIAQGELCELSTALSDVFFRDDRNEDGPSRLIDEMLDVELQRDCIERIAHEMFPELFEDMNTARAAKYIRLLETYGGRVTCKELPAN